MLEVADTGVGIPEHELPRLFERFHRVSGAQLRTHEGSGIGLALVAELARLHGGEIAVESEAGVGSTFRVLVPYGHEHLDPETRPRPDVADEVPDAARLGAGYLAEAVALAGHRPCGTQAGAHPAHGDDNRPIVLVVDDNADMLDYVHSLLADDYAVAHRRATASRRCRTAGRGGAGTPDLVLTDVMMPVLDGFGLLAAIRRQPGAVAPPGRHAVGPFGRGRHGRGARRRRRRLPGQAVLGPRAARPRARQPRTRPGARPRHRARALARGPRPRRGAGPPRFVGGRRARRHRLRLAGSCAAWPDCPRWARSTFDAAFARSRR